MTIVKIENEITNMQTNIIPKIQVCPTNGTRKEDMIKHFQEDSEKQKQTGIWPYAKYAAANQPDICIGNCEQCKAWKLSTEKELYIKDNKTFINRLAFDLSRLFAYFFLSLPITITVGYFIDHDFRTGIFLSLFFATFIYWLVHDRTDQSFEKWLGKKYTYEEDETNHEKA